MAAGDTLILFTPESHVPPAAGTLMTFGVRNGHLVLEASAAAADCAVFAGIIPHNYIGTTGITALLTWAAKTAAVGTIGWDVTFERNSGASGDDITADHWQTAQPIPAVTVPAASGLLAQGSVACAAGAAGTASVAAGDAFRVRIRRLNTDTAAGFAQLLAVELRET